MTQALSQPDLDGVLEVALAALAAGDRAKALETLVDAWRIAKHPRLADLVDHAATELVDTKASNVDRDQEIAAFRTIPDPTAVDIGNLLARAWPARVPARFQNLVDVLLELSPDPRVAATLASLLACGCLFDARARVLERVEELGDVRAVRALRAFALRFEHDRARAESVIARLSAVALPELPDVSSEIEAHYAAAIAGARRAEELLVAIHEDPENRDLKAVYADLLSERSDPRGELIHLQLAVQTPVTQARITELLRRHGVRWAGSVGSYFKSNSPYFELEFVDGFCAGGIAESGWPTDPETMRAAIENDAGWRLVRTLRMDSGLHRDLLAVLGHPRFAGVRVLHYMPSHELGSDIDLFSSGAFPGIEELAIMPLGVWDARLDAPLASCAAFPALRTFGVMLSRGNVFTKLDWLRTAPVLDRVARFVFTGYASRELLEAVALHVSILEIHVSDGDGSLVLRREPGGVFESLVVRLPPSEKTNDPEEPRPDLVDNLGSALLGIPRSWVRELDLECVREELAPERYALLARILADHVHLMKLTIATRD